MSRTSVAAARPSSPAPPVSSARSRVHSPARARTSPPARECREIRPGFKVPAEPTSDPDRPFETPKRISQGGGARRNATQTPLQDLDGIITPADLHLRTSSRRRPGDRSVAVLAVDSRHGRASAGVHARRSETLPGQVDHPLPSSAPATAAAPTGAKQSGHRSHVRSRSTG